MSENENIAAQCRHFLVESWDSHPPTLICCQCGADISPHKEENQTK